MAATSAPTLVIDDAARARAAARLNAQYEYFVGWLAGENAGHDVCLNGADIVNAVISALAEPAAVTARR